MLVELQSRPFLPPDRQVIGEIDWSEVAALWNANELGGLHDWLNQRWSRLIRNSVLGFSDPEAEFLQALAFATLALYFTQNHNQEGALMMADDAVISLAKFMPRFMGVEVEPIVTTLTELRPKLVGIAPDAECPEWPFTYAKFKYHQKAP